MKMVKSFIITLLWSTKKIIKNIIAYKVLYMVTCHFF
jgi:hypothetical protein